MDAAGARDAVAVSTVPRAVGSMASSLFEGCPDAVLAVDRTGSVVYGNRAAGILLGVGSDDMLGLPLAEVVQLAPRDASNRFPERAWALGRHRDPIPVEVLSWDVLEDPLITRCVFLRDARLMVAHEVLQADATESLRRQARLDPLTGLANRFELDERSAAFVAEESAPWAAVVVDLDGFKAINDIYGHAVGDDVLVQVARRLERAASVDETVARLGGDEFVLLARVERGSDAERLVQRISTALRGDITTAAGRLAVDISLGGALATPGETVSDVIRRADKAMYRRKAGIRQADGGAGPAARDRGTV